MSSTSNDVAVFWDYASCPVPGALTGYAIVQNIRSLALRFGNIKVFKAYLSVAAQAVNDAHSSTPLQIRSQIQSSGVSVTDVPGGKDVAGKMLIVDMLAYAFDRPTASTVLVLISGDPTLAYALSILRLRNHHMVVVTHSRSKPDLLMQASLCFDWDEEIVRESEARWEIGAHVISGGRVPKGGDFWDDQPPYAPRLSPEGNTPTAGGDVVLEDYIHVATETWPHTRDHEAKEDEKAQHLATSGMAKAHRALTVGPKSEHISQIPSSSVSPLLGGLRLDPPARRSLKQLKKGIPFGFRPLVDVLYALREEGHDRPLRSCVGMHLIQKDPKVYERVGYTRFGQYASMAVALGIAEIGGRDGQDWISFHPSFDQM